MSESLNIKLKDYYQGGRTEMLKFIPETAKKVLEIGCGEGNFGSLLKAQLGAEVWGIEYEPEQATVASKQIDKILCGDVMLLVDQLPEHYFDVIICNDVLEHLTDPYTVLKKIKTKLTDKGVVVSSLPNIRYFRNFFDLVFRRNWDYTERGIMDFTHFRFFTINSIRKMYENLDYEIMTLEGINPTKSLKPWPIIILTLGLFSDIKYLQFVTVAKPKK
jgi:SAM-dependent methyltransferase